jgi:hypothetical protein
MKKRLFLLGLMMTFFGNLHSYAQSKSLVDFLPEGYIILDTLKGDLNKDGLMDVVMIIKGTDHNNIVLNEYRGELDRNRRGIILLFNMNNTYQLAAKNYDCFSSENEDGGVYFPPDLYIEIQKNNLYINYDHGRYGSLMYTFRYQNGDFELIGYDERDTFGPVVRSVTSINFLTKKKLYKENINFLEEDGAEVFKETWIKINIIDLIKLSEIKDFDSLDKF